MTRRASTASVWTWQLSTNLWFTAQGTRPQDATNLWFTGREFIVYRRQRLRRSEAMFGGPPVVSYLYRTTCSRSVDLWTTEAEPCRPLPAADRRPTRAPVHHAEAS